VIPDALQAPTLTAAGAFIGVIVGAVLTAYNQKRERRQRRVNEQLSSFYGPMLALRLKILSQTELRENLSNKADEAWRGAVGRIYEGDNESLKIERMAQLDRERWPSFEKLFDYSARQFTDEIVPSYRQMVDLFTSKIHLAEQSTIAYLPVLTQFVEIWNRWLNGSLPGEVLGLINHTESALAPFYEDVLENYRHMQSELSEKRRRWGWWRSPRITVRGPAIAVNPFSPPERPAGDDKAGT
jgi:hypothetical protein